MRTEHGGAAVLEDVANRVEARVDSRRVLNLTLGDRHVEIASHEHLLALELEARDRYNRHRGCGLELLRDERGNVREAVRGAPFVCVPGKYFPQPLADDFGERRIENRRMRIAVEIDRDQRRLA